MSRSLHTALAAGACAALLALSATSAGAAPADVRAQRAAVAALQERLAAVDARAGEAAAAHNAALDRRDAIRGEIARNRARTRATERVLAESREDLERRLVRLYVSGAPDPVAIILGSDSLAQAAATLDIAERAAAADAATVARMRTQRAELARLRARLAEDAARVAAELDVAAERRRELDALAAERRAELAGAQAALGRVLAAERRRQARLAAQRREARRKAAAERAAASAGDASRPASASAERPSTAGGAMPAGSHVFPIAAPSTFSDDWLASRAGGRYHEGIDLFAERGSPVVAVAGGTVYRVGYSGISGNRFWLRDAAGTTFFYAHLDGFASAAREGATVAKGTVLGYVGDTGDARGTSPHVHFEIHPGGGGPTRPYPIVSAWPRIG